MERRHIDGRLARGGALPLLSLTLGNPAFDRVSPGAEPLRGVAQVPAEAQHDAEVVNLQRVGPRPGLYLARLVPKLPGPVVAAVKRFLQLVLVPLRFPGGIEDEHLIQPADEGIADAEERLVAAGRRFAAARHANDRGFDMLAAELRQPPRVALRAEQALERRLFGAEIGPLAALQPILQTQPIHEYGMDQVGDLLAHKRYFFSCGTT